MENQNIQQGARSTNSSMAQLTIEPATNNKVAPKYSREVIALVAALGFALLLTGIFIGRATKREGTSQNDEDNNKCTFMETIPKLGPPRTLYWQNDLSPTDKVEMAQLTAYMEVDGKGYLPLDFERMSINDGRNTITFEDKCVNVTLLYQENGSQVTLRDLGWVFIDAAEKGINAIKPYEYCKTTINPLPRPFSKFFRYSQLTRQMFQCRVEGPSAQFLKAATLVIATFELEFSADRENALKGKFTKEPLNKPQS